MVIIMSLYGACEGLTHMPGGILANLYSVPAIWMINIPHNFVMALPWNLLVAGPISRFVFRRAFPVGTVFEEEHAELLEQAMAPGCRNASAAAECTLRDVLSAGDLLGWSPKRG